MKQIKILLFIIGVLVAMSMNAMAQRYKPEKTASARAYYGATPSKPKLHKKQKHKVDWRSHSKPARGTRVQGTDTRRRARS
jgi:hypothetical protein